MNGPSDSGDRPQPIFVLGYPGDVGGANTELWHTVKLWRQHGIEVTLVPTCPVDPAWKARLDGIGCRTEEGPAIEDGGLKHAGRRGPAPGFEFPPGSIVVGFCNSRFLACGEWLKQRGCRTVWVSCMNWLFPAERLLYRRAGTFDCHVFQSRYQRDQLVPQLCRFGFQQSEGRVIRGAFAADEFPFRPLPHAPGEPFRVGRVSRAEPDKFARNLWQAYARIPHPVRVRVLGWGREIEAKLGAPPRWAECFAAGSMPVAPFYETLHAMVPLGGGAVENWPRVGLEAMAAGVPVVAEAQGGWNEMIRHGRTGYLCRTEDEFAYYTARLAYDEPHRLSIARQARAALIGELVEPGTIFAAWQELFAWVVKP